VAAAWAAWAIWISDRLLLGYGKGGSREPLFFYRLTVKISQNIRQFGEIVA
jgi:hypothetical protein